MSLDAVLKLKECFDVFDVDKGGSISIDELLIVIEGCGLKEKEAQILGIINSSRHTGDINFQTFLEIFGFHEDHNSEASLQQIFEVFDPTNSGAFGPLEFENVARQIGEHFSTA